MYCVCFATPLLLLTACPPNFACTLYILKAKETKKRLPVMESSLSRLGSGSSRIFLLLLEKLEPKNQLSLIGSTEKKSGLKSLIFYDLQSAF
jgi:hypothetical protein